MSKATETQQQRRTRKREFVPPPDTLAAIFITPTQCAFQRNDGVQFTSKQVSPSTLRLAFSQETFDTNWLAEGAVRWGATATGVFTVGYYPPARYKLSIRFAKGTRRMRVPMPALIFAGIGTKYYIWAMKGKTFNASGQLFYAPLPNLNEFGHICFGANAHPDVRTGGFGPSWKMFWESPFTDHHMKGRSLAAMTDVREHLLKLHRARALQFPQRPLVPMNVTLGDAVDRLINRGSNR